MLYSVKVVAPGMQKLKKLIDIFPPEKLVKEDKSSLTPFAAARVKKYYDFPLEGKIEREKEITGIKRKRASRLKKSLFFVFLFLCAGFFFLHFVSAKVNIEIWPKTETLNLNEQLTVDVKGEQLDFVSKVIPGKIFETEKSASQQFNSAGKVLKENNAQGIIRVYNNYSLSQTLVANTRFQPPLEKVIYFRTTRKIVIPSKSYVDIEVIADRPGEEYNIEPTTFSVPGLVGLPQYYSVYGKSFSQMTSGFKGLVNQVKQEDLDTAKKSLLEKIKKETRDSLINESSKEYILLDEGMSQEVIEASSSVPAGTEEESFIFNLRIKSKAIGFEKSNLDNFVKEVIKSKIQNTDKEVKEDKSSSSPFAVAWVLEEQSLKIDYSVTRAAANGVKEDLSSLTKETDLQSGKIILNLKISAKVYSDINEKILKKALFGKSVKESQLLLESQSAIAKKKLNVFPFWLKIIPESEDKIKIKLNID